MVQATCTYCIVPTYARRFLPLFQQSHLLNLDSAKDEAWCDGKSWPVFAWEVAIYSSPAY
jgi:hypothetical protein